jgi:biotin transport system ATP-binding protein
VIVFDDVAVEAPDGAVILHDVTLTIADRRVAVIGANGSGKTTLVRLVNGLTAPTRGTVTVEGVDVAADRRRVQRRVGFVFNDADHQLVYPTPVEDIALSLRARGIGGKDAREAALDALRSVRLEHKAEQAIHTLSAGEKHLVALCAVLVLEPDWIVVDEPTTTLDLVNRRRVTEVLLGLPHRLIVVSHDLDLVARLDRAVLVDGGTVVAEGAPGEVAARYVGLVEGR